MPYTLRLDTGPLDQAVAKLERIAGLYDRISAANQRLGGGAVGGGGVAGGGGGRTVSGKGSVGNRGGRGRAESFVENLMRSQPGLSLEAATRMAGNMPGEQATFAARQATAGAADFRSTLATAWANRQAGLPRGATKAEYRAVERQLSRDLDSALGLTGGGRGGGGGGGRGGPGGGGMFGRGGAFLRERIRLGGLPGSGLIGSIGGPYAIAAGAVLGFAAVVRSSINAVEQLRRGALMTGGTMQEMGMIAATGGTAAGAERLRQLRGSDPFAMMTAGFAVDPRLAPGSDRADAATYQMWRQRLHDLRNQPDYQRFLARRLQMTEDLPDLNVSEQVWQQSLNVGRGVPNARQAQVMANAKGRAKNLWTAIQNATGQFVGDVMSGGPGKLGMLGVDFYKAFRELGAPAAPAGPKGPDSLQATMDRQTMATMELISTMKQTQRDFFGRGSSDRGSLPNSIFGADLMRGIRSSRIRMGAFRHHEEFRDLSSSFV